MSDFPILLESTQAAIRLSIAARGVPLSEVDDIAQDVYIDFYNHQEDRPADVEPIRWLMGMARNHCLRYFGKRARQGEFLRQLSDVLEQQSSPLEDAGSEEDLLNALKMCMSRLPDKQRVLLQAYYGEDEDAIDRAASSVRMSVMRLRDGLRQCVLGRIQGRA